MMMDTKGCAIIVGGLLLLTLIGWALVNLAAGWVS